ncbi:glycosyltransferase [Paenibacillus ginsengarvi]|uniref:Glycosyltransferase n=1 Tax=Paenibacillus ginsengarvi TaxID=400777 RepID=A0A3B0CM46_9BACL|nr:glycosyltransferase [Paenibacillus ginsengarvi]RKN85319.1 glycosyltransferase [Paenibacillus ginsengarvi]
MIVAFCVPLLPGHFDGFAKGRYIGNLIEALGHNGSEHSFVRYEPNAEGDSEELCKERLGRFLAEQSVDLFLAVEPYPGREYGWRKEWFGKTKVAVLLLGRIVPRMRDSGPQGEGSHEMIRRNIEFIRGCDLVLTVSESLRREAIRSAGIPASQIEVVAGGIDARFGSPERTDRCASGVGTGERYLFCAGAELGGRQGEALIAAIGMLNPELDVPCRLVIEGEPADSEREKLLALSETAGIRDRIRWTGPIGTEELASLYGGAELFLFLAAEGALGLPILEAMACGTPVMAQDRAEWNEVGEDAVYRTDLYDPERLHIGLRQLLSGESPKKELVAKGKLLARKYEWRTCAEKVLRAFGEVCRKRVAIIADLPSPRARSARIPLLLPMMTEHYDCDIYAGDGWEASFQAAPNKRVRLLRHEEFPDRADDYKEIIYLVRLENGETIVSDYMVQYPGIVLVEDDGASLFQGECDIGHLLRADQCTLVVHRAETARLLTEQGCRSVIRYRKPFKLPVMVSAVMDRDFTFACYGTIEPGDGLESAMECIRSFVDGGYDNVRLWVGGDIDPGYREQLQAYAGALGLTDRIELLGPLEENEYGIRMSRSDVCLYLREPRSEEPTDELLEMMSYGKPTVVLGTGAHLDLPDDTVRKTDSGTGDREPLFESMFYLYKDAELRKKMRKQARAYVSVNHSATRYASRILSLIDGREDRCDVDENAAFETDAPQPAPDFAGEAAPPVTDADPLPEVAIAEAEDNISAAGTLTLEPNRIHRVRKGKSLRCYFSFDLAALPPGATIRSAVMFIPARGTTLRVHRISRDWNEQAVSRRKPRIRPKPLYRKVRKLSKRTAVFRWDCTELACKWLTGAVSNYGVYAPAISAVQKPWLSVEYG